MGRLVSDYTEEFYRLCARNNLNETETQQVARYIGGLKEPIQNELILRPVWGLSNAVNLTHKLETQLQRGLIRSQYARKGETHHEKAQTGQPSSSRAGHRSNECPQRRLVNLAEEYNPEKGLGVEEEDSQGEVEIVEGDEAQRYTIFRTRCTIKQKVYNVIINSGSSENIVSKSLVRALQLKTESHPSPYRIGWIKKGAETKVSKVCRVPFSIGKYYNDEHLKEVGCALLLLTRDVKEDSTIIPDDVHAVRLRVTLLMLLRKEFAKLVMKSRPNSKNLTLATKKLPTDCWSPNRIRMRKRGGHHSQHRHRRKKTFDVGDLVMVHIRKERLLTDPHLGKLQPRRYGPFHISHKVSDNAYVVGLPDDWEISSTFNVADLYTYFPPDDASMHLENSGSSSFQEGGN
ncbi:hypothetical protein L484_024379 [Morus notabilis]|uniref:Tf2-1-like SH3-like domain-containing protein n=1 Tax=Morus notabilis TaxID=981085 RepID=W9S543_9ROSA|nr:hypothetical protein L484_024379 [Morus notabilis]